MSEAEDRQPSPASRWRIASRLVLIALAIGVAVSLYLSGAFDDPEGAVAIVRGAGAWGVVVYLLAFSFLQPFGISGHAFVLAAAVVWGGPWGFAIGMAGALGAASVGFAFGRYVAHDWVQAKLSPRMRRYEVWMTERGLWGMIVFRTLTFTSPPGQLLVGTLRIPYPTMLLGTAIGFAPTVAVDMFLGGAVFSWLTG